MDFLIATHNKKKRDELQRILLPLGINVYIASEKGITLREVEETGETFAENALLKAEGGCEDSGLPCIADDSGLVVDALGGRPGVYSARYGGEELPYPEKIAMLLSELENVPEGERTARFVSSICCVFPSGEVITAEGMAEGKIGFETRGANGFGYDPIFYCGEKSFAELTDSEKDTLSHRGKALRALAEKLS